MTPAVRTRYFSLWGKACRCQKWDSSDQNLRRDITRQVMDAVRGPATDSTSDLGPDEITALFTFLEFKASESLEASARWIDCQKDYVAFNRAKQADWHEEALYGKGKKANKLDRNRFSGERSALGQPLAEFDPEEARKRHLTMASRHQKKQRKERAEIDDLVGRYHRCELTIENDELVPTLFAKPEDQAPDATRRGSKIDAAAPLTKS